MTKKLLIPLIAVSVGLLFLLPSCRKDIPLAAAPTNTTATDSLITRAKTFFEQSVINQTVTQNAAPSSTPPPLRISQSKTADWSHATVYSSGIFKAVIVPVRYAKPFLVYSKFAGQEGYSINDLTRLCIYEDSAKQYHSLWLSFFPDSNYSAGKPFTGFGVIEDWAGNPVTRFKYEKGRILQSKGNSSLLPAPAVQVNDAQSTNSTTVIETCYTIYGYNYDPAEKVDPIYWSESLGCEYTVTSDYTPVTGGGGGGLTGSKAGSIAAGGTVAIKPALTVQVAGGNSLIGNISDYDKCFSNVAGNGHVYTVTVCVDQPVPGSRTTWGLSGTGSSASGNPVDVGHTFLVLTETYAGVSITRNIGFYPENRVNPASPISQGQLNNDASHNYNISLSITLTNSQFFTILNGVSVANNSGYNYNLNTNNCTSFALHMLNQASIFLPATIGTWLNGSGNDPGDLGEDIRSMTLSSNMTRNTSYTSHPNIGSCN